MYRAFLLSCLLLIICVSYLGAQSSEVGLRVGTALYSGDLHSGGLQQSLPVGGLFYRHRRSEAIAWRADLLVGALKGSDSEPLDVVAEKRNRSFRSNFGEISASIEYYFFYPPSEYALIKSNLYLFAGIGALLVPGHDNTSAEFSRFQPVVPFGIGLVMSVNQSLSIGLQASLHKTFFDYLDNTSATNFEEKDYTYGDLHSTDRYYSIGLTLSYTIYSLKCPFPIQTEEERY